MLEKDKQLLLKDICARLPYGVKGRIFAETTNGEFDITGDMIFKDEPFVVVLDEINVGNGEIRVTAIEDDETRDFIDSEQDWGDPYTIETFKPYLRPMSSMTEDEKNELKEYLGAEEVGCDGFGYVEGGTLEDYVSTTPYSLCNYVIDWFNAHHFDYKDLIELGLALPAPEGMY